MADDAQSHAEWPRVVVHFQLVDLSGWEVSGVAFVRDYVEFHFDGPILRALSQPSLAVRGETVAFPAPGSRDALCSLIGREVMSASDESEQLVVTFHDRVLLVPKASESAGAEVAHLVPIANGKLDVTSMLIWEDLLSSQG